MKLSSSLRTLVGFLSAPPIIRISVPVNVFAKMMYRQFWDIMYLRTLQLRIGTDFFNILGQTNKHSVCVLIEKNISAYHVIVISVCVSFVTLVERATVLSCTRLAKKFQWSTKLVIPMFGMEFKLWRNIHCHFYANHGTNGYKEDFYGVYLAPFRNHLSVFLSIFFIWIREKNPWIFNLSIDIG